MIDTADGRVVLDETSTTAPEAANSVDVRVKRTINAGEWSTICLPFAMTVAQCQAAFGNDVQIGDFTGYTYNSGENRLTVNFSSVTAIAANHPYIIKVSTAVTEFTVDGVDVNPVDDPRVSFRTSNKKLKDFVGTYVADFDFVDMLPEADAARIAISFGDATSIHKAQGTRHNSECTIDNEAGAIYDLSGRKVANGQLKKGVYIKRSAEGRLQGKNGKKVIVK